MNIDVAPPAGMQENDFFIKNKKKNRCANGTAERVLPLESD